MKAKEVVMTDKVQKIREELARLKEETSIGLSEHENGVEQGRMEIINALSLFLDSMQKEPVSEDLEEEIDNYVKRNGYDGLDSIEEVKYIANYFAEWQKENLWKSADGDDLPEYDREVIAILDYDFGHYKVVYAHRPNPNGWNGTNIDTGEKEHFEPEIYDKGGWNQPHVLYWLDARLPYEKNIKED